MDRFSPRSTPALPASLVLIWALHAGTGDAAAGESPARHLPIVQTGNCSIVAGAGPCDETAHPSNWLAELQQSLNRRHIELDFKETSRKGSLMPFTHEYPDIDKRSTSPAYDLIDADECTNRGFDDRRDKTCRKISLSKSWGLKRLGMPESETRAKISGRKVLIYLNFRF